VEGAEGGEGEESEAERLEDESRVWTLPPPDFEAGICRRTPPPILLPRSFLPSDGEDRGAETATLLYKNLTTMV